MRAVLFYLFVCNNRNSENVAVADYVWCLFKSGRIKTKLEKSPVEGENCKFKVH